jgi:hypothetical protein
VSVIGDVVGYYTPSSLTGLGDRVAALEAAQPFAVSAGGGQNQLVGLVDAVVRSVTVTAPVAGTVTINSSNSAGAAIAAAQVRCSITTGTNNDYTHLQVWESPGAVGAIGQMSGTRAFPVAAGSTTTFNLVCSRAGGNAFTAIADSDITAIFTPDP